MDAKLALIGFGEAGSTFAKAAHWTGRAYDVRAARKPEMVEAGLAACETAADALADADIILSLVTADQALTAARDYAPLLKDDAIWCDMNSVAPSTKRAGALAVEEAGGRYADVAILAPVSPAGLDVPLLISGSCAKDAADALTQAGFTNLRTAGAEIGRASAIKMIRSVMIKGIEALTDEMMAAAVEAGVAEEVLHSLDASERSLGWTDRAAYNLERMKTHGLRRSAEMQEVGKTLSELGVNPVMTNGSVIRQRDAAMRAQPNKDAA